MINLAHAAPIEIVPNALYALGGLVALDGRISWAPANAGYQPVQCYLLPAADPPTLIDTGLHVHRAAVIDQLRELLSAGGRLDVFLTRSENDCVGNVGAVMGAFELDTLANLYTGGGYNPFDGFDDATTPLEKRAARPQLNRVQIGADVDRLGQLSILTPPFRTLTTYWAYHAETRTLFTSDLFGHTALATPDAPPILDSGMDDDTTIDSVRDHLLAKFFWLDGARTTTLSANFAASFNRFDVEIVAPTHGRVLRGRDVVRRHYDLVQATLADLGCDR